MPNSLRTESVSAYASIRFTTEDDLGIANALVAKSESPNELSLEQLENLIEAHGFSDWQQEADALEDILKAFIREEEASIPFAKRLDASWSFKVSADHMLVEIDAQPARGGKGLSYEVLKNELLALKIDPKRINRKALKQLEHIRERAEVIVSAGKPPKTGKDSYFEALISDIDESYEPEEDDTGKIDFLSGRTYTTIGVGTPLVKRHPPEAGKMGMDVYGQLIPAETGKEIPFAKNMPGTAVSTADPNLLIASVSGHPILFDDGARVDQTLTFDEVGLNTGHVTFDGSLEVSGDVRTDIKINVTGDVFVKGVVERATIKAGHNIHIAGGALGDTNLNTQEEAYSECCLIANGSISVRYANLAKIQAQRDISIREYAFNSQLRAGSHILLGQSGGKGNLVGGSAIAGHAINAKILGSKAYLHTRVRVGASREELQQVLNLKQIYAKRLEKAHKLETMLNELKEKIAANNANDDEQFKAKKIHGTLCQINEDLKSIEERINVIEFATFRDDAPNISATAKCFPNCFITINGAVYKSQREHRAISFVKEQGRITAKK